MDARLARAASQLRQSFRKANSTTELSRPSGACPGVYRSPEVGSIERLRSSHCSSLPAGRVEQRSRKGETPGATYPRRLVEERCGCRHYFAAGARPVHLNCAAARRWRNRNTARSPGGRRNASFRNPIALIAHSALVRISTLTGGRFAVVVHTPDRCYMNGLKP